MHHLAVRAENLVKSFGTTRALDRVSLEVRPGEFFSLLGPSGCGKTTLLRVLGGFESPDSGRLELCGQNMADVPPQTRPVNTVFQSYALFPHLSVFENVAFGLRMRGNSSREIGVKVNAMMERVRIGNLAERKPQEISGGQRQRVALARALVNEPAILLLDEPLAAVDARLRRELQVELKTLQRDLKITFIYVTHDQEEALAMSDRVAVMNHGSIEQMGAPLALYERPFTRFVATFLGNCNLLSGEVAKTAGEFSQIQLPFARLKVASPAPSQQGCALVGIRPEKISFREGAGENTVRAIVREIIYSGAQSEYLLEAAGTLFRISTLGNSFSGQTPKVNDEVAVHFPAEALFFLRDDPA